MAATKPPLLDRHLNGIDGWLVLVAIGLVCGPIRLLASLGSSLDAYSLLNWQALTIPGGVSYQPACGPVLTFELLGEITTLILGLFVVVLFFQKHPVFPRWFIALLLFNTVFLGMDVIGVRILGLPSSTAMAGFVGAVVTDCIWIPYICVSRRVKVTFGRSSVPRAKPVLRDVDGTEWHRPEPVISAPKRRHYHGGAHMIFLWLCVLALPLTIFEMNLKNHWTTGISVAVLVASLVFAVVSLVKQRNSDMPKTIKCLPILIPAGFVLFLLAVLFHSIALGAVGAGDGKKTTPPSSIAQSIVNVVYPSYSSCLGFVGLALLIRFQSTPSKPSSVTSSRS